MINTEWFGIGTSKTMAPEGDSRSRKMRLTPKLMLTIGDWGIILGSASRCLAGKKKVDATRDGKKIHTPM